MTRPKHLLAALALLAGLSLGPVTPARAQEVEFDPNGGVPTEESKGDPWVGYGAFGALAVAITFAICKSARRSHGG
jgi:hypothetical protein